MRKNALLWILRQIRGRIPAILLMTAAQVGQALFGVLFALGSRGVIDSAVSGEKEAFLLACVRQALIILGMLLCQLLTRNLREKTGADLERDWKRGLLHGLLHGDYAGVSGYHSAELLNRLNNDVAKVNDGVLTILPSGAAMVTRLVAAVAVLGVLDIRFTLLVAAAGLVLIGITAFLRRKLKELNKEVSQMDGKVSGFLQESMEKLLVIQAMDISQEVERRSDMLLGQRYRLQRRRKNVSLLANTGISIMYYGAGFFALCWCAGRMLLGQMTFGSLTAVIQLVNQLQAPFVNLSGVMPKYIAMTASAERLMELEAIQGQPAPMEEDRDAVYAGLQNIAGENLCFSYGRDTVFENADFSLPKGAFAVITGPSGAGKSTLLKLLLGVYTPESGTLYAQHTGDKRILDRTTRQLFAYVPQGNLLFSGTIRDNLTVVNPEVTEEALREAIHISAMDEFLSQLPQGLDTILGESGAGLSEGQAQRLSIARAVLGGAPILLLDECTSALDTDTERTVLSRIRSLPNRTCIAVTHRPAAVELSDWQLEVWEGKILAKQIIRE